MRLLSNNESSKKNNDYKEYNMLFKKHQLVENQNLKKKLEIKYTL